MSSRPGRTSRLIDAASMVLVGVGGWLFLSAFFGMRELRNRPPDDFVRGQTVAFARTAEHARLTRTSRIGLGVVGFGMLVGLSAAMHARQIARRNQTTDAR